MDSVKVLWIDDEIELLKPHFIFLGERGYSITGCTNGQDALDNIQTISFDVVLLDENMPGLNGLETLDRIKSLNPNLPVVMITKNEEEQIIDDAIGSKISDYLIKPVNPYQILTALKKTLDHKSLVAEKTAQNYRQEFRKIGLELTDIDTHEDWIAFYKKMMYWEQELETLEDRGLFEIFEGQIKEANQQFAKFISKNYESWIQDENPPVLSHRLFKEKILPRLSSHSPTLLVIIDNLRYDQWRTIAPTLNNYYKIINSSAYFSILPTATQYARNAIFSGLTPLDMERLHPEFWKNDTDEGGKNQFEEEFLSTQLKRLNFQHTFSYHKITQLQHGRQLIKNLQNHINEALTVVVYNFVDMISHAKTEMELVKELAPDNKAYRSLTLSWFNNSPLIELLQKARQLGFNLMLTTDHGTINVTRPIAVVSDKSASLNLRYKTGRNLSVESKKVLICNKPNKFQLPDISLSNKFIFAQEDHYFVYKSNYNQYVNYFRNTFQHGGISMEEMIIPFVVLSPR